MINPQENTIILSPIGKKDAALVKLVCRVVTGLFGYETDVVPLLEDVRFSFDPGRDQHYSTMILEKLEKMVPAGAIRVAAITDVDLFIPVLTYVYGEAQLRGKTCIVSTHRLKEGLSPASPKEVYYFRVVKEVIHELGHTFGLRHCPNHSCIMHYCRNITDVDNKSEQLCRYCSVLLEDEKEKIFDNL